MSDKIVDVTDATFDAEVLQADKPTLLDFWAEWCGPCKAVAPVVDEIAEEYADKIKVAKIDIDANSDLAVKYGIRSIPTFMLVKGGEVIATKPGVLSKSQLAAFIDSNV